MSKPIRRSRGRILLVCVFVAAAIFAGILCLFRAPDVEHQDVNEQEPETDVSVDNALSAEEAAAAAALAAHMERKENFYTILVSGIDDGNGGSDTNILLAVDAGEGRIHGVSIPRDTKCIINSNSQKINYAYAAGGMPLLADTVSHQLGIPVDFTVKVNLKGFIALVDAIGGVNFYVPVDMDYDDPLQNLSIHYKKGMQHLSGQQAMEVVRFRHNTDPTVIAYGNEDIGRMNTQQEFLKAVAKQTLTLSNVDKVGQFAKIFQQYVETDLSLGNLAWLGKEAIAMGTENITFSTLPGTWKSPYIYLDQEAVLTLINESLNPYVEDRVMADLNIPD